MEQIIPVFASKYSPPPCYLVRGGGFCLYGKSEVQENGFRLISKQPSEMFKKKRYAMLPTGIMTTLTFKNKLIISPLKRKKAFL